MKISRVYDMGIRLINDEFGTKTGWDRANAFYEFISSQYNLEHESGGTGFGIRDCQLRGNPEDKEIESQIEQIAKAWPVDLDYVSSYFYITYDPEVVGDEVRCPNCHEGIEDLCDVEQRQEDFTDEVQYWYTIKYQCDNETCPVAYVNIDVPGYELDQ